MCSAAFVLAHRCEGGPSQQTCCAYTHTAAVVWHNQEISNGHVLPGNEQLHTYVKAITIPQRVHVQQSLLHGLTACSLHSTFPCPAAASRASETGFMGELQAGGLQDGPQSWLMPTIRVNGKAITPSPKSLIRHLVSCRTYVHSAWYSYLQNAGLQACIATGRRNCIQRYHLYIHAKIKKNLHTNIDTVWV